MSSVRSRTLNLLMALLASMTLSLQARAQVCGRVPVSPGYRSMASGQAGFDSGALPGPAHTPLCRLQCRGFVASLPDAPQQPHTGTAAPLEILAAYLLPVQSAGATRLTVISPPDTSPPRSSVLRL